MTFLEPRLPEVARQDSKYSTELSLLFATIKTAIPRRVAALIRDIFEHLDANSARELSTLIGIDVTKVGLGHLIEHFRDENIRLVEEAARSYADKVRDVFDQPFVHTVRVEELKSQLKDAADVSDSRAELIARDQVLKFNGQVNKARQQMAGITQYVWSTSQDERVRPDHAELEGETFDWNNPPVVDQKTGRRDHPGNDFQCRCVAVAVVPGLED